MNHEPVLAVEALAYTYPDGTRALDGVSFTVAPGEHVAVVGANGAGKSTLLLQLVGLLHGTGSIRAAGMTLGRDTLPAVRRAVGLVFQDPDDQLFCPTVAEDVAFGPRQQRLPQPEIERRVTAALAAVDLSGQERRPPHHLSLGQRKRAAIAAVLAMEPQVLVLDEPTGSLDPRSRRGLIHLLAGLGKTLVIATHDLPLLGALCQRVLVLSAGRLIADTTPAALLGDKPLLDAAGLD
jgi:cobalt/nickel transport system ATP-binding protein